jgi:hypothetical protein
VRDDPEILRQLRTSRTAMTSLEEISTSIPVGERDADSRPTVAVRASQPSAFDALMARLFALYLPPDDSPPVPVSKPSEDKMDYFNVDSWDGSEDKECSITTKVVPDALTPANADADAGGDTLLHIYQLKMDLVEDVPTPRGSMAEHLYSCLESLNKVLTVAQNISLTLSHTPTHNHTPQQHKFPHTPPRPASPYRPPCTPPWTRPPASSSSWTSNSKCSCTT